MVRNPVLLGRLYIFPFLSWRGMVAPPWRYVVFIFLFRLTLPAVERTGILGSTRPLKLDTLQCLAQRWDSPQATLGMPYPSWIAPSSFLI